MAKQSIRAIKLTDGITHQAICSSCSYAGDIRETRKEAEIDAAGHVSKPGKANHQVRISTIETSVKKFVPKSNK